MGAVFSGDTGGDWILGKNERKRLGKVASRTTYELTIDAISFISLLLD